MNKTEQRQALLSLRSQLVGKMHVQPFTIYKDETVEALVKTQPKTLAELSKVKGFPKDGKRIKGFGEAIIAIFTAIPGNKVIPEVTINKGQVEVSTIVEKLNVF